MILQMQIFFPCYVTYHVGEEFPMQSKLQRKCYVLSI